MIFVTRDINILSLKIFVLMIEMRFIILQKLLRGISLSVLMLNSKIVLINSLLLDILNYFYYL